MYRFQGTRAVTRIINLFVSSAISVYYNLRNLSHKFYNLTFSVMQNKDLVAGLANSQFDD